MCKSVVILLPYVRSQDEVQGSDRTSPSKLVTYFQPFCMLCSHGIYDTDKSFVTSEETVTTREKVTLEPSLAHMLTQHTVHDTSASG